MFLIGELDCRLIRKYPLLYCKLLEPAVQGEVVDPVYKLPLLRDAHSAAVRGAQFLLDPVQIKHVWSAAMVHSAEHQFQVIFAK